MRSQPKTSLHITVGADLVASLDAYAESKSLTRNQALEQLLRPVLGLDAAPSRPEMKCWQCGQEWTSRVPDPVSCPRCLSRKYKQYMFCDTCKLRMDNRQVDSLHKVLHQAEISIATLQPGRQDVLIAKYEVMIADLRTKLGLQPNSSVQ